MKSEIDIQREIVGTARMHGALVFRMNAGRGKANQHLAPAGTPDLLLITRRGNTVWVEVKGDSSLSGDQAAMHTDLREHGQIVIVARSIDDVLEYL